MTAPVGEVLMYSTSWCGFCERARGLLRRVDGTLPPDEVFAAIRAGLTAKTAIT